MFKKLRHLVARLRRLTPRTPARCRPRLEFLEDRLVPATFQVTTLADVVDANDGQLSLREAITRANATTEPDTIVLRSGVHRLGLAGANENANASGDFDITNPLTIVGQGSSSTAIDAGRLDRHFEVLGTIGVTFSRLTLRNGGGLLDGGAIRAKTANLRLDGCAINGNTALSGGGISTGSGNVTLIGCTVNRNTASADGGGIETGVGQLTLRNSVVANNLAGTDGGGIAGIHITLLGSSVRGNFSTGGGGGGIFTTDEVILRGSTVSGNFALSSGGGIQGGEVTLTNSTVSGNSSNGLGGGIRASTATLTGSTVHGNYAQVDGGGIRAGTVTLTSSTISGNFAGENGGGLQVANATLVNSTISGNFALGFGGGIYATAANVLNCTITLNSCNEEGAGIFHDGTSTFSVKNSIIAQNNLEFGLPGPDVRGSFTSLGNNLIGDGAGSTGFGVNNDQVGTFSNPLDARLAPLAFNGGPTKTHALLPGSRALDRGDNSGAPATDQRGVARPRDGDGNGSRLVDIGAFER